MQDDAGTVAGVQQGPIHNPRFANLRRILASLTDAGTVALWHQSMHPGYCGCRLGIAALGRRSGHYPPDNDRYRS